MVKLLAARTPAKLNLFLRVTGRRADGYHELDSLFVPITLYDKVELEMRFGGPRSIALRTDLASLPNDNRNLAARAAAEFLDAFKINCQVTIALHKAIPVGAGLGGGSSDAAAVLKLMHTACRLGDDHQLRAIALRLGADVPFFLAPRAARVRGIGEQLSPLEIPKLHFVVLVPPFEVSTAAVYGELKPEGWSGPIPDSDLNLIVSGRIEPRLLVNDLAPVAFGRHPEIQKSIEILGSLDPLGAAMSGSGGAVFAIFVSKEAAEKAAAEVQRRMPQASLHVTHSVDTAD